MKELLQCTLVQPVSSVHPKLRNPRCLEWWILLKAGEYGMRPKQCSLGSYTCTATMSDTSLGVRAVHALPPSSELSAVGALREVYDLLASKGGLALLQDPQLRTATAEVPPRRGAQ